MRNSFFNFNKPGSKSGVYANTTTLTDVLLRSLLGPRQYADDEAPPVHPPQRELTLDYPRITAQPEYAVEAEKLNRFNDQLDKAIKDQAALQAEFNTSFKAEENSEEGAITKAETLLAGEKERDIQAEMRAANKLIEALRKAVEAQQMVVHRVNQALSRQAGQRYADEHKERVKRVMAAVIELVEANKAELWLRDDLLRLGYNGDTLRPMTLRTVEDPSLVCENVTYYWFEEAKKYVQTDAQVAAGVRKARLDELTK